jgi:hypothetical protein
MTYWRKLRSENQLVWAAFYHFNRGLTNERFHLARVRYE